jgi:hypothetical protein
MRCQATGQVQQPISRVDVYGKESAVAFTLAPAFVALGELGIVEPALASRLAALARLRNLLLHGYTRVDDRRLRGLLRGGLADVAREVRRGVPLAR